MRADYLTRSWMLARNTLLAFFGYGAPLVVAVLAISLIVEALGKERFGILTLAWVFDRVPESAGSGAGAGIDEDCRG